MNEEIKTFGFTVRQVREGQNLTVEQLAEQAGMPAVWLMEIERGSTAVLLSEAKAIADALGVEFKPYYVSSDFLSSCSKYDFRGGLLGDKAHSVVFDNTKLKRAVPGLSMNVRFEQGVRKTLEYVLSHPECQVEDPEFDAWCDKVIAELEAAKKRIMEG